MAKITVDLEAFYGYSSGFHGHGSNEAVEIEVSEKELDALKKFGKEEITAEDVVAAIESGDTTLESLHEQLSEKFYYMVEVYWLYEAYNEFLYDCLAEHIEKDISDGSYTPVMEVNEDADYEEGEENYDLDAYYEWVKEHDHDFVAERVGLDICACREDNEVDYTINLDK